MTVSVGLHYLGLIDTDSGLGVQIDGTVIVPLPTDVDLDVPATGTLGVEPDDSTLGVISGNPDVVDDPLHPALGVIGTREEVVEGCGVVIDNVVL